MHTGDIVETCLVYSLIDSGGSQIYFVSSLIGGGAWQHVQIHARRLLAQAEFGCAITVICTAQFGNSGSVVLKTIRKQTEGTTKLAP